MGWNLGKLGTPLMKVLVSVVMVALVATGLNWFGPTASPAAAQTPGPSAAASGGINYEDFSNLDGLVLNGTAKQVGDSIRLTEPVYSQRGSVWSTTEILANRSFSSQFTINMHAAGSPRADGIAFVLQSAPEGGAAIGAQGGDIGYGGIEPSVAVEFDIFRNGGEPNNNHIAVTTNGNSNHIAEGIPPFELYGGPVTARVDYNAHTSELTVNAAPSGSAMTEIVQTVIDLESSLGSATPVLAGFTAATGTRDATQELDSWSFGGALGRQLSDSELFGGFNPSVNCVCTRRQATQRPVDTASGNFWHTFDDLDVSGRGEQLALSRTYNSGASDIDSLFGYGWSFGYDLSVQVDGLQATVIQENGSTVTFDEQPSGEFTAPPRVLASLERNPDDSLTFERRNAETFEFDATGKLVSMSDLNGYVTDIDRPDADSLVVTEPGGRQLDFALNGDGRIESVTDPGSRVAQFEYDAAGDLVEATDFAGGTWTYTYDADHRMVTMREPRFHGDSTTSPVPVTTNVYDSEGRTTSQIDPQGRTTTFDYASVEDSTVVTEPNGKKTLDVYAYGLLEQQIVAYETPEAVSWDYRHDPVTLGLESLVDPNGNVWEYAYDEEGNEVRSEDPLGRVTETTYNDLNLPTSITDAAGTTTEFTYDANGNPLEVVEAVGSPVESTTTFEYDPNMAGDVIGIVDANGNEWTTSYHPQWGYPVEEVSPEGLKTTTTYNELGWVLSEVSPRGNSSGATPADFESSWTYNEYGDVMTASNSLDQSTSFSYDGNRNLTSVTDPENKTTSYEYNAVGEVLKEIRPDNTEVTHQYDGAGNVTQRTDGGGNSRSFTYDEQDRVATSTDALGRTTSFTYDAAGNRTSLVHPNGDCGASPTVGCISYSYDDANQLMGVAYSDDSVETTDLSNIAYDGVGRRTAMTDGSGAQSWSWDAKGRLVEHVDGAGRDTDYGYDEVGNVTSIKYPGQSGSLQRNFDDDSRMVSITDWLGQTTDFDWDADSNLSEIALPTGTNNVDSFAYDNAGRSTGVEWKSNGNPYASETYSRDSLGQVEQASMTGLPLGPTAFDYDELDRLTGVDSTSDAYAYNPADQLTKRADGTSQAFDAAGQLCWASGGGTSGACQSPPADADQFSYDDRGNRTEKSSPEGAKQSLSYDGAGNLAGVESQDGPSLGQYQPSEMTRILDTRQADSGVCPSRPNSNCNGVQGGDSVLKLKVAGEGGVPETGVDTVVINLKAASPTSTGWAHIYPSGTARQTGSALNYQSGENASTVIFAKLGSDGAVNIYTSQTSGFVADVQGWFMEPDAGAGESYNSVGPERLLDTRSQPPGQLSGSQPVTIDVAGNAGVPEDASSVVVSLKATNPSGSGFLKAFSADQSGSSGSVLTYNSGETSGDTVVVKLSSDGKFTVVASTATHLGIDVFGYFTGDAEEGFTGQTSERLFDTRSGPPGELGANTIYTYQVAGEAGVPNDATSVVLNFKAASPQGNGYMRAWSDGPMPNASMMNMTSGKNESATAIVPLAPDGTIQVRSSVTTHLVVDVHGYFSAQPNSESHSYEYDGDNLRTAKTDTAGAVTEFSWDRNAEVPTLLAEHNGAESTYLIYGPSGLPIGEIDSDGTSRWYHLDQLGSVRAVTNSSGSVIGQFSYDAYGNAANTTGNVDPLLDYAGQYRDNETGFQYLRARYYDPQTAQFISQDPLVDVTGEPYAYASNNPTNFIDPTGMIFKRISRAISSPKFGNTMNVVSAGTGIVATGLSFVPAPQAQLAALAFGGISAGTGALGAYSSGRQGDVTGAALGVAGFVPGVGGVLRGGRGLFNVTGRHFRSAPYSPWLRHRSEMDMAFAKLYSGVSAGFGSLGAGWGFRQELLC